MSSLLSLGFEYDGTHHSFLARVKPDGELTNYVITVMNDELQGILKSDNIIQAVNGKICPEISGTAGQIELLRHQIANAIVKYLNERSLTSY